MPRIAAVPAKTGATPISVFLKGSVLPICTPPSLIPSSKISGATVISPTGTSMIPAVNKWVSSWMMVPGKNRIAKMFITA